MKAVDLKTIATIDAAIAEINLIRTELAAGVPAMTIRVALSPQDFRDLVAGREVEAGQVRIILSDIGFVQMLQAIRLAQEAAPPWKTDG